MGTPAIFIFFFMAILINCFSFSFTDAQKYWHVPALVGIAFSLYTFTHVIFPDGKQNVSKNSPDIEANPHILKKELEKTNRAIPKIIKYLMGTVALGFLLRPSYLIKITQIADLFAMGCFLAMGAYFREVLHVYSRIPGISDNELEERFTERNLFQLFGWGAIGFFFLKLLTIKGKTESLWNELPELQLPSLLLVIALCIYLIGIVGILSLILKRQTQNKSNCLFNACITFGSIFPLVWLYSYIHPYLFTDSPAWLIQIPILIMTLVESIGIYFSFQSGLNEKILGNSCLQFVKNIKEVLTFIFLWATAILYLNMSPILAALIYGPVFAFGSWIGRSRAPVITTIALTLAMSPFFLKIREFPAKIEAQKTRIEKTQKPPLPEKESSIIY